MCDDMSHACDVEWTHVQHLCLCDIVCMCVCVYVCTYVGGVSEHETLGNVECYDPETDRWVVDVIPQMRYRRSGVGVAVLQGLLFAIGGYLEGKTSTDAVECYNPRTKR